MDIFHYIISMELKNEDKMKWFSQKCSEKIPDQRFSCNFYAVIKYSFFCELA